MGNRRIELLDSFRFIAILAVLLYHYTWRWGPVSYQGNKYPYGGFFGGVFSHGYMGVMFFFIISGFVISYTLENTPALSTFFRNRFIRLFPPMLLCSLITWLVALVLDKKDLFINAHYAKNLLPGLTFVNPGIWSFLAHERISWISGSYWTIWTEVQFYVIVSVTYFSFRKSFFRNILLVTSNGVRGMVFYLLMVVFFLLMLYKKNIYPSWIMPSPEGSACCLILYT